MEGSNKPDDVITELASNDRKVIGLATNKILSFTPDNPYYTTGTTDLYKVTTTNISEEGRRRFDEGNISGLPNDETVTNHYYSNILKQQVLNKTDGNRNYTQESRIGKGNPGIFFEGKNQNNYTVATGLNDRIDKINALDIHDATDNFNSVLYRDLIRFRFEAMKTDEPDQVEVMAFRAFLDDYGDNYNASWNSFKYNGRGEDFYTYGGFKRDVNFSFKIAAQSRAEMMPLYRKLNYLCTTLAPDYNSSGRMRGSFIKVTIGAMLDRVPGFLTTINLKWQKDYPWEIAIGNPEGKETDMHVLPHVLDVSCNFTPIHDFVPRKSISNSPFFGRTGGDARGWDGGSTQNPNKYSSNIQGANLGANDSTIFTPFKPFDPLGFDKIKYDLNNPNNPNNIGGGDGLSNFGV